MPSKRRRLKGRKGEYLVLAELAHSGISAVHLARVKDDEGSERFVIFRELLLHLSQEQESVDRFLKEAKITHQFDHPNLVPTHEVVKMQAGYFSISEFLVGDGLGFILASAIKGGLGLPMFLAAEWIAQACEGVGFVHLLADKKGGALDLIHKNINLRNLIVLSSGLVKVVNFDIARPGNRPHPARVTAYMSPEQCVGKQLDARTDVFSLGVVFWELLTRRHLFMREDDMETRRAVMACKVAPVSEFRPDVKPEFSDVAMRALNKDPAQRFENAGEMAKVLRAAQGVPKGTPPDPKEAHEYLDVMMSERFQAKLSILERIEASEDAEVDPDILLPNASVDFPPVPEDDPHGFDREPVTQKDRGKQQQEKKKETPPSLPPKPTKKSEAEQAEVMPPPPVEKEGTKEEKEDKEEEQEEKEVKDITPPPFKPSIRVRESYQKYLLPGAIAGGVLIVVLILIAAWPSGDESEEAEAAEPQASGSQAALVVPAPQAAAEQSGAAPVGVPQTGPAAEQGTPEDAPQKPDMAVLEIVTDPKGCLVHLDALKLEGKTPLSNVIIPANTEYRVLVKCKGYKGESREVVARPGERLKLKIIPSPMKER